MKKYRKAKSKYIAVCSLTLWLYQPVNAQIEITTLPDSVITVGYARGTLKNISGSVEQITEQQMNKEQITNPLEAIQGRVPGLTIMKSSNGTAALESVRMRGTTSLTSGNDPLIIVDGVLGDLSMLTSIYPTDIESFTILKDASETAQYGSRGASGVINITTKKGISGKTRINYNGSFGIAHAYRHLDMLSGDEYRKVTSENGISILDKGCNTDFQKEIEQLGLQQNHNIAFYGGGDASNYRVSLGYLNREGVIQNESMKLFTSNMNMSQDIFDKFIQCELGLFGSVKKNRNLFDYQKTFYSAAAFNPTFPNHKDYTTDAWDQITTASQITNPLAWMEVNDRDDVSYFSAHARLNFNLSPDLKFILFGSYTYNDTENSQYLPTIVWANGQAYRGNRRSESVLGNAMLTYRKQLKKHFIDVLGLAELEKNTYTGFYTTVTNFSSDLMGFDNLQAGALRPWEGTGSYYEEPHLASFLGRVNYTYDDRYVLTVNARTDASSKFGANHKWGFFPSVSAAWNIKGEQFLEDTDVLSILKLRAGYGVTGTVPSDPYMSLNTLNFGTYVYYNNQWIKTIRPDSNANPELRWEKKKEINIGVDFGFWEDRITGNIDYYNRKTEDLLWDYDVPSPPYLFSRMVANAGSMRNQGIEAGITVIPVQTKDFQWTTSMNYSTNKNELLSLSNDQFVSSGYSDQGSTGEPLQTTTHRIQEGQPIGNFWGYKSIDIDENGHWIIEGADGSPKPISQLQPTDKQIIGNGLPKHYLNWNNTLNWKNFDFNMTMRGAFGFDILNMPRLQYESPVMLSRGNVLNAAFDTKYGKVPLAADQELQYVSYYIEKGNYWKIDNVTLGYTFKFNSWIKRLRIYGTISNLATITGYSGIDPEVSISGLAPGVDNKNRYPSTRTYTLGISVKF